MLSVQPHVSTHRTGCIKLHGKFGVFLRGIKKKLKLSILSNFPKCNLTQLMHTAAKAWTSSFRPLPQCFNW